MTTAKLYLILSLTKLPSNIHIRQIYWQLLRPTSQQLAPNVIMFRLQRMVRRWALRHLPMAHVLHTRQLLLGYLDKREKLLPVLSIGMLRLCRWALVRLWVNMLPWIWVWNCRRVTYLPRRPTWWCLRSFVGMLRQPRFVLPIWHILLQMQYHWQRSKFRRSRVLKTMSCLCLAPAGPTNGTADGFVMYCEACSSTINCRCFAGCAAWDCVREARACFAGGFALETCPINYPWRYTRHIERSKPSSQPSELKPLQLNNRVMLHTAHPVDISRDASLSAGERDATMM